MATSPSQAAGPAGKQLAHDSLEAHYCVLNHVTKVLGYEKMPTVNDFCWDVVHEHFLSQTGYHVSMGTDFGALVYTSSSYAIACQHLGMIDVDELNAYIDTRSGYLIYLDHPKDKQLPNKVPIYDKDYVTFRDLLKTLELLQ